MQGGVGGGHWGPNCNEPALGGPSLQKVENPWVRGSFCLLCWPFPEVYCASYFTLSFVNFENITLDVSVVLGRGLVLAHPNQFFFFFTFLHSFLTLDQGLSNISLEGQSAAEFSSNPDQTRLPVIF